MADLIDDLAQLKAEVAQHLKTEPLRADAVTAAELRDLLHLDKPTFYRWQRLGKFKRLEIDLGPRTHKRYSRKLVMALLNGTHARVRRTG
jgi:hypothetical protein